MHTQHTYTMVAGVGLPNNTRVSGIIQIHEGQSEQWWALGRQKLLDYHQGEFQLSVSADDRGWSLWCYQNLHVPSQNVHKYYISYTETIILYQECNGSMITGHSTIYIYITQSLLPVRFLSVRVVQLLQFYSSYSQDHTTSIPPPHNQQLSQKPIGCCTTIKTLNTNLSILGCSNGLLRQQTITTIG